MIIIPDYLFERIYDIKPTFFKEKGIDSLILDIDNTLTYDCAADVPETVELWLDEIKKAGIKAAIVSNNHEHRVKPFAESCKLTYVAKALKPSRVGFERSCKALNATADSIAVIGDQLFTDIAFGNRFNCTTIMVERMGNDIPWFVKLKRVLEAPFMVYIRARKKHHD